MSLPKPGTPWQDRPEYFLRELRTGDRGGMLWLHATATNVPRPPRVGDQRPRLAPPRRLLERNRRGQQRKTETEIPRCQGAAGRSRASYLPEVAAG